MMNCGVLRINSGQFRSVNCNPINWFKNARCKTNHYCTFKKCSLQHKPSYMSKLFGYAKFFSPSTSAITHSNLPFATHSPEDENPIELFTDEDERKQMVTRSLRIGSMPHQVLIIHPHIKWGPNKKLDTTPDLELEEAVSLIETLDGWKVVSKKKISLLSFDSHTLFNDGQLETIVDMVKQNELITGVFINLKSLKVDQHLFLEKILEVPVFDRYSIVINIFKKHAITREAKIQVSLAEIPYIRSRIRGINEIEGGEFAKDVGIGANDSYLTKRLKILSFHEQKLKKSITRLRKNRDLLRNRRKTLGYPIVAVVGYTNAGKTSLIKRLTEEEKMEPKDKLFATLDVTMHAGVLPCNLKVLYVDTIGFISDIPTNLLEPFVATLEDALYADLVIHVQDISHPGHEKQKNHVDKTLEDMLDYDLVNTLIRVGNKCDKVSNFDGKSQKNFCLVSCKTGTGLEELQEKIEKGIIRNLDLQQLRIRVTNGGKEYQWLQKEAAIGDFIVDETDQQYAFLDVTISKQKLEQFMHYFVREAIVYKED